MDTDADSDSGDDTETGPSEDTEPVAAGCDRAGQQAVVESFLNALAVGDPSGMPLASDVVFNVNDDVSTLAAGQGIFAEGTAADFHRSLIDEQKCASFTEVICASWSHQYVLGVLLELTDNEISRIYVVETDDGDWAFGADGYLDRSPTESWDEHPEGDRIPRDDLDNGARAYFDYWGDKEVAVPWGDPCARLEGGSFGAFDSALSDTWTTDGQWGSCSGGIPDQGFALSVTESFVDVNYGMVVLLLNLGGADSHMFYFVKDDSLLPRTGYDFGMRYVHTLTEQ